MDLRNGAAVCGCGWQLEPLSCPHPHLSLPSLSQPLDQNIIKPGISDPNWALITQHRVFYFFLGV